MRIGRGTTKVKPGADGIDPTEGGQYCGAKTGKGVCRQKAGAQTDHLGEGRCKWHGGLTPVRSGRYSAITSRPRIAQLLERFENDPDPLNLHAELALLRASILDFVERYDEMHEGLMRWQLSFNPEFQKDWGAWLRAERARLLDGGDPEGGDLQPDPMDYVPRRPVTILDLTAVTGMLAQAGGLTDRINKMREDKTYGMGTISRLYEVMGADLEQVAREVMTDDDARDTLLDAVEQRWKLIQLSGLTGPRPRKDAGEE